MMLRDPQVLPLKVVRIDGQLRYLQRADQEQAVAGAVQGNFFTLDVGRVRAAARRLPWVDEVSVRRIWPDTLHMRVREQIPLALWGEDRLVNRRGEVFQPALKEIPQGLPRLDGPLVHAPRVVEQYQEMSGQVVGLALKIERLELDARQAWMVKFRRGLKLQLGSSDMERRLSRFIRIYPRLTKVSERRLKSIDLRYTNGLAVEWEDTALPATGDSGGSAVGMRSGELASDRKGQA
jgi:cell division protein FtsQ